MAYTSKKNTVSSAEHKKMRKFGILPNRAQKDLSRYPSKNVIFLSSVGFWYKN
jgi:hypothetical protein